MDSNLKSSVHIESIEDLFREIERLTVKVRHFRTGKMDYYGHVVGIKECPEGKVPFVHQDHFYDEKGRVIKMEKYENDFSKPTKRIYFYAGDDPHVAESVWFDRYDRIDNIHRYLYDKAAGLMVGRAEYTKEGRIFYTITSKYDRSDPPLLVQEIWNDLKGTVLKDMLYQYDGQGRMTEERLFGSGGIFKGINRFAYDDRGLLVERKWQNSRGITSSTYLYEYDDAEEVTRVTIQDGEGKIRSRQEFFRDEVGNVLEERWYDRDGKLIRHLKY
ncbi:MAG: hypothetical protein RDV48_23595 [Candidatus Eremiobacteraeota bacterium]|nr:hypothetical protein [Candidatus Eremiobacteraeota bacterium]